MSDPVTFKDDTSKPAPAATPSAPPAPAVAPAVPPAADKPAAPIAAVADKPEKPQTKHRAAAIVAPASRFCFTLLELAKWSL